jgi:TolB-like protein/DNA-binding winged helix-turn-helix (wHTH) protein
MIQPEKHFYAFGPFVLDPGQLLLTRAGEAVEVPPKALETLRILVENSDRIVDKEELMKAVWPETFVEENNLNQCVSSLRKALGDAPRRPRYIATFPSKGYRFIGKVRSASADELGKHAGGGYSEAAAGERATVYTPRVFRGSRAARYALLIFLAAAPLLAAAIYFGLQAVRPTPQTMATSIAVLPFKPLGSEGRDEFLELGMADALIAKLSNVRQISVRPTSVVRKFAGLAQDPAAAGRELGVDVVLDGSIQHSGERLRVTVQLVRASDGASLWAERFDEKLTGLFAVQDSVSEQVARALTLKLTGEEKRQLTKHYTENTEAYQAYVKGRYYWTRKSGEGIKRAIGYFEEAIRIEPNYALAHAGLADSYSLLGSASEISVPPREALVKAKDAALRAIRLDDRLAEAHASLGLIHMRYDWDWAATERELRRAIELNPSYGPAHLWYADYLLAMGRPDEAVREAKKAYEIDPLSLMNRDAGRIFLRAGLYTEAIGQYRKVLEIDPDFPLAYLGIGMVYEHMGKYPEAIVELERARTLSGGRPGIIAALGHVYAVAGMKTKAGAILRELDTLGNQRYVSPSLIGLIHAALGDKDLAFACLEKAFEQRSGFMVHLKTDPRMEPLRSDPRFADLVRRIGLPP